MKKIMGKILICNLLMLLLFSNVVSYAYSDDSKQYAVESNENYKTEPLHIYTLNPLNRFTSIGGFDMKFAYSLESNKFKLTSNSTTIECDTESYFGVTSFLMKLYQKGTLNLFYSSQGEKTYAVGNDKKNTWSG